MKQIIAYLALSLLGVVSISVAISRLNFVEPGWFQHTTRDAAYLYVGVSGIALILGVLLTSYFSYCLAGKVSNYIRDYTRLL